MSELINDSNTAGMPADFSVSLKNIQGDISRLSEEIQSAVAEQAIGDATYALEKLARANKELEAAVTTLARDTRAPQFSVDATLKVLQNSRRLLPRFSKLLHISLQQPDKVRWVTLDELVEALKGPEPTQGYRKEFNSTNVDSACRKLAKLGLVEIHGVGQSARMRPSQLAIDLIRADRMANLLEFELPTSNADRPDPAQ